MYALDSQSRDELVELTGLPQCSPGAPMPLVLADDMRLVVAYLVHEPDPSWDGTWVDVVGPETDGEPVALVAFPIYYALSFGPPNDEALRGHPLHERGLQAYAAYEVRHSTWIRRLERMNSVHSAHRPEHFAKHRHFVFTFHDSTLECVAQRFDVTTHRGSLQSAVPEMQRLLWHTPPSPGE